MDLDKDTRRALEAMIEAERDQLGPHPEPETLVEYYERALDSDGAERVREHLVFCRQCARLVLDLGELAKVEEGPDDPSTATAPTPAVAKRLDWRGLRLAAILALAAVGLGIWVVTQRLESHRPTVDKVFDRGGDPHRDITRTGGVTLSVGDRIALIVPVPPLETSSPLRLRIVTADGTVRWSQTDALLTPANTIEVDLPRNHLEPGIYWVEVHAIDVDAGAREIVRYRLPDL